ncbi:MAG: methylmalonyl Co-A mutase-associated GTPase MeaB [Candidatus Marinimicrobia bacterium]|nr:methylmalonyl Co-A mutase-associated GTPase MeaB [Candidatus Neomarinimicrobiota bacterium]MBL7022667.1 methylmalonyl Co-A mutase-associated GTPase MeaB [Candidatus Neomarinimicrobiota bacterium]MBL7109939.1 methylmalonyl Co-A mutase-associated GTPase MeaB [Candidatus Neomarinimicrobiota bacterium]
MTSDLIKGIQSRERISIARAISIIESENEVSREILSAIFPFTGKAYRIGITGPPGSGKSSLTDKIIKSFRNQNKTVAVIGVDPSSPFTGGALLGDRIRMLNHHKDAGVFIRSMASRGGQGGLAQSTREVGDVFDAAGYDVILFETVGVGQVELDVIQATDTVFVVLVPESGDEIQMMKAGLMEIADVFVINKADREGANKLAITLKNLLSVLPNNPDVWKPKVVKTIAIQNDGIDELVQASEEHRKHIISTGHHHRKLKQRYIRKIKELIVSKFELEFWNDENQKILDKEIAKDRQKRLSPYQLVQKLHQED